MYPAPLEFKSSFSQVLLPVHHFAGSSWRGSPCREAQPSACLEWGRPAMLLSAHCMRQGTATPPPGSMPNPSLVRNAGTVVLRSSSTWPLDQHLRLRLCRTKHCRATAAGGQAFAQPGPGHGSLPSHSSHPSYSLTSTGKNSNSRNKGSPPPRFLDTSDAHTLPTPQLRTAHCALAHRTPPAETQRS